jgi:segregation and condensation protein B
MSLKAQIEAIIYVAEEPVTLAQLNVALCPSAPSKARVEDAPAPSSASVEDASASPADPAADGAPGPDAPPPDLVLESPSAEPPPPKPPTGPTPDDIRVAVEELMAELRADSRGIEIKEVAGGYKMATKPEHHEAVRRFVKSLKPPMKLSLAALETLAVVAYRQPVTIPEIGDVRGVNTGGVIKTLLDKRLISTAGRKNVIGRPMLYKTTKEFLVQFGLKDVSELPSLKEFEELARSLAEES